MFPSVGLAPGQTLRLTLFNPAGEPVRVQAQLHHPGGIVVGLADGSVKSVSPGGFESFNFNRSEIPFSGEDRTGRIQLRASFIIKMAQPAKAIDGLAVSMETIEISDGTSNTFFFNEVVPTAPGRGGTGVLTGKDGREAATQAIFMHGVLMGIVPGQTLRVTIFNPPSFESGKGSPSKQPFANGHVKVFDGSGNPIKQSDDVVIQPGEFRSFDFDRDALGSGEPGTNRKQVRAQPFFEFSSERLSHLLASFEIVNNSTGKTEVLSGQQCLVFFLGGMPGN